MVDVKEVYRNLRSYIRIPFSGKPHLFVKTTSLCNLWKRFEWLLAFHVGDWVAGKDNARLQGNARDLLSGVLYMHNSKYTIYFSVPFCKNYKFWTKCDAKQLNVSMSIRTGGMSPFQ